MASDLAARALRVAAVSTAAFVVVVLLEPYWNAPSRNIDNRTAHSRSSVVAMSDVIVEQAPSRSLATANPPPLPETVSPPPASESTRVPTYKPAQRPTNGPTPAREATSLTSGLLNAAWRGLFDVKVPAPRVLVLGDSLARYLYVGLVARAKSLGFVLDDGSNSSAMADVSGRNARSGNQWELFRHSSEVKLCLTQNNQLSGGNQLCVVLRFERSQYLDSSKNWTTALRFRPTIVFASRGPWDLLFRSSDNSAATFRIATDAALDAMRQGFSSSSSGGAAKPLNQIRFGLYGIHRLHDRFKPLTCPMLKGAPLANCVMKERVAHSRAKYPTFRIQFVDTYAVSKGFPLSAMNNRDGLHYIGKELFTIVDAALAEVTSESESNSSASSVCKPTSVEDPCPDFTKSKRDDRIKALDVALTAVQARISALSGKPTPEQVSRPGFVKDNLPGCDEELQTAESFVRISSLEACVDLRDSVERGWGPFEAVERWARHRTSSSSAATDGIVQGVDISVLVKVGADRTINLCQEVFDSTSNEFMAKCAVPTALRHRFSWDVLGAVRCRRSDIRDVGPEANDAAGVTEARLSVLKAALKVKVSFVGFQHLRLLVSRGQCAEASKLMKKQIKAGMDPSKWALDDNDLTKGSISDGMARRCTNG